MDSAWVTQGLPRRYRPLQVGALLDGSVQLFRQRWVTFATYGAVALVPSWLLLVVGSLAGVYGASTSPGLSPAAQLAALGRLLGLGLALALASAVLSALWLGAMLSLAQALLQPQPPSATDLTDLRRGQPAGLPGVGAVYRLALGRLLPLIGAELLVLLGLLAWSVVAMALFVLTLFGILGTVIALIGLLFWWLRPAARRPWLKWLIILTTPFGLPLYYGVRWSLCVAAVVLERRGPLAALRRASQLAAGQWFFVAAVLLVVSVILSVLVSLPSTVVGIAVGVLVAAHPAEYPLGLQSAANTTVSSLASLVFSSLGVIAYTSLFVDLRNRREGADLAERIGQLEVPLSATDGG